MEGTGWENELRRRGGMGEWIRKKRDE